MQVVQSDTICDPDPLIRGDHPQATPYMSSIRMPYPFFNIPYGTYFGMNPMTQSLNIIVSNLSGKDIVVTE